MSLLYENESYTIIGLCMEVHNVLGAGFLEIVYKDALEIEFRENSIPFKREVEFEINYKGNQLKHKYYADFVLYDKIILEIKTLKTQIGDIHISQTLNYLKASNIRLGLIMNFGKVELEHKRLIL